MPRNNVVVICVLAGMILGFQGGLAFHLSQQGQYYLMMVPIVVSGFAVAIATICLFSLVSMLPRDRHDHAVRRADGAR